jgi:hypothetical protein
MAYLGDVLSGSRGIRQNTILTLTLHYPDAEDTRATLETKRQWVVNQAYGPILKFLPQLGIRNHNFDTLFDAFMDGDFMAFSADQPICLNPFELTALGRRGRRGGGAGHRDGRADREAIRLPDRRTQASSMVLGFQAMLAYFFSVTWPCG